ncbi:protein SMG7 [Pseudoscourfieldia marina]
MAAHPGHGGHGGHGTHAAAHNHTSSLTFGELKAAAQEVEKAVKESARECRNEVLSTTVDAEEVAEKARKHKTLLTKLRMLYENMMFADYNAAQVYDVETKLWKGIFHPKINEHRKKLAAKAKELDESRPTPTRQATKADPSQTTTQHSEKRFEKALKDYQKTGTTFRSYLNETAMFYQRVVIKLQEAFGDRGVYVTRPSNFASNSNVQLLPHQRNVPNVDATKSLFRSLVSLGDLARYVETCTAEASAAAAATKETSPSAMVAAHARCDYRRAEQYYVQALALCPGQGSPHNQLAVLSTYSGDPLSAAYRYVVCMRAPKPFTTAPDNLKALLGHATSKGAAMAKRDNGASSEQASVQRSRIRQRLLVLMGSLVAGRGENPLGGGPLGSFDADMIALRADFQKLMGDDKMKAARRLEAFAAPTLSSLTGPSVLTMMVAVALLEIESPGEVIAKTRSGASQTTQEDDHFAREARSSAAALLSLIVSLCASSAIASAGGDADRLSRSSFGAPLLLVLRWLATPAAGSTTPEGLRIRHELAARMLDREVAWKPLAQYLEALRASRSLAAPRWAVPEDLHLPYGLVAQTTASSASSTSGSTGGSGFDVNDAAVSRLDEDDARAARVWLALRSARYVAQSLRRAAVAAGVRSATAPIPLRYDAARGAWSLRENEHASEDGFELEADWDEEVDAMMDEEMEAAPADSPAPPQAATAWASGGATYLDDDEEEEEDEEDIDDVIVYTGRVAHPAANGAAATTAAAAAPFPSLPEPQHSPHLLGATPSLWAPQQPASVQASPAAAAPFGDLVLPRTAVQQQPQPQQPHSPSPGWLTTMPANAASDASALMAWLGHATAQQPAAAAPPPTPPPPVYTTPPPPTPPPELQQQLQQNASPWGTKNPFL